MTIRKLAGLLSMLALGMAVLGILPSSRGPALADSRPHAPPELRERAEREGRVRVLVRLRLPYGAHVAERWLRSALAVANQRADIADTQAQILSRLPWRAHRLLHRYRTVPFLAVEVSPGALAELAAAPHHVAGVLEDRLSDTLLSESVPLIEADQAWEAGLDGSGTVVAIIDTGVEGAHSFLAGKVVEEACYSSTVPGLSTSLCPNGEETQTGPGAGVPCTLEQCWHGTHVAGIAAGDGAPAGLPFSGVARGARIMAVQVFSRFDRDPDCGGSSPCARAFDSDVLAGLERVYMLRSVHNFARGQPQPRRWPDDEALRRRAAQGDDRQPSLRRHRHRDRRGQQPIQRRHQHARLHLLRGERGPRRRATSSRRSRTWPRSCRSSPRGRGSIPRSARAIPSVAPVARRWPRLT